MEAAGEEGPHPRIREEGHGVDTEPQESRLQQALQEDDVQHLGSIQVRQNMSPASAGLLFVCLLLLAVAASGLFRVLFLAWFASADAFA